MINWLSNSFADCYVMWYFGWLSIGNSHCFDLRLELLLLWLFRLMDKFYFLLLNNLLVNRFEQNISVFWLSLNMKLNTNIR